MILGIKKLLSNQKGFSLVELILYTVIGSILLSVTANILSTNVDAYSFIKNRQSALSDVRYALNRMNYELLRLGSSDLTAMTASSVTFTDSTGVSTDFRLGSSGGVTALMRGAEVLASPIQSFQVIGLDESNTPTNTLSEVRKIEISLSTEPVDNEGSITLTTTVVPRAFMYVGYQ